MLLTVSLVLYMAKVLVEGIAYSQARIQDWYSSLHAKTLHWLKYREMPGTTGC